MFDTICSFRLENVMICSLYIFLILVVKKSIIGMHFLIDVIISEMQIAKVLASQNSLNIHIQITK